MGLIQSIVCSVTFCVERVVTWACFAAFLIGIMFMLLIFMLYGISVGYHYAQKELASFAKEWSSTTMPPPPLRRAGGDGPDPRPVVRLVAVNRTKDGHESRWRNDMEYRTSKPKQPVYMEVPKTPIILLETERPQSQGELLPDEREIARKIISRFRRSKKLRILNTNETNLFRVPIPAT